jgi:hypothetical protein
MGVEITDMAERCHLLTYRLNDSWMGMTQDVGRDTGEKI